MTTNDDAPYNPALHEHMLSLGYEWERVPDSWEDVGTAESGPHLTGGPAYDEYSGPDEFVYCTADGVMDREVRNVEFEKWLELNAPTFSHSVH